MRRKFQMPGCALVILALGACKPWGVIGRLPDPLAFDAGTPGVQVDFAAVPIDQAAAPIDQSPAQVDQAAIDQAPAPIDQRPVDVSVDTAPIPVGPNCPVRNNAEMCTELFRLPQTPTIDGQPECNFELREIPRENWRDKKPIPRAVSARYAVAYHPRGLYFWVAVIDPTRDPADPGTAIFCGDAVHLFVDTDGRYTAPPRYDDVGTRQLQIAAPSNDQQSVVRGEIYDRDSKVGSWGSRLIAKPVKDGYVVEAFVEAAEMGVANWTLSAGNRVGFSLSVSLAVPNSAGSCDRLGDFALLVDRKHIQDDGMPTPPHVSTDAFCNPLLR